VGASVPRLGLRLDAPDLYQQSARELEQAGFDFLIEDAPSLGSPATIDLRVRHAFGGPKHDPLLLAPYLFQATTAPRRHPDGQPRRVPAVHGRAPVRDAAALSGDRLGLNVVTDTGSARHFGDAPALGHDAAYDRAEEWLAGIRALWASWGEGALVRDASSGVYADGTRLDATEHRGAHFAFDGPLNAIPFDEVGLGEPVIASPGGSGRGLAFAGRTPTSSSRWRLSTSRACAPTARDPRRRRRARAAPRRHPIMFAIQPVIVSSSEEADRLVAASAHPDEVLRQIAQRQSSDLETDLTTLDLDEPPDAFFAEHVSQGSLRRLTGDRDAARRRCART
jgi:alkanesulfonate monooxygenase SsuD/methylene tetrahydromethanopterin reductase-like flavin-dependent oxidoreductase (luciferase family)